MKAINIKCVTQKLTHLKKDLKMDSVSGVSGCCGGQAAQGAQGAQASAEGQESQGPNAQDISADSMKAFNAILYSLSDTPPPPSS